MFAERFGPRYCGVLNKGCGGDETGSGNPGPGEPLPF